MKTFVLATMLLASAAPAYAADDHKPQYGGVVAETKAGDMELVARPDQIVIYVSYHAKPMKLTSAIGKITVFNGNDKIEAPLTLAGDRLEAKGSFILGAGTKVLVDVALNGKPAVAARFTLK
ncbi:MAG: hypothetical protein J0H09_19755 [Burkholderiales bacterium]|nr:hypothetical protein [Burkholderiales bacterium]